jgi:hemolysin activation/secretion protein
MPNTRSTRPQCVFVMMLLSISCMPLDAARARDEPNSGGNAPDTVPNGDAVAVYYFDVREYRVLGNTVLSEHDIETSLNPLLGEHKNLTDVESARAALEKTYHDRGFRTVFVDIPEQDVADHIVRLNVTEGRLHEVHVLGARHFSERKILSALPAATVGAVPDFLALQLQLTKLNQQSADLSVVPVLSAGSEPGTVDLSLKVDDHLPFHGSVQFDNQYTPNSDPLRATVAFSYGNLFQEFDSLSAEYQNSPQKLSEINVFAANYAWAAFSNGLRPSLSFVDSNSNVPAAGTDGVLGIGQIYSGRLAYSLNGSPTQSITFGADYKHFRETIGPAGGQPMETPVSYFNLSLAYSGSWSTDRQQLSVSTAANYGPRDPPSAPGVARQTQGESSYFYQRLEGSVSEHLPKDFQLIVRGAGQFTVDPLVTNEDFSISGADGVRGYLEAESLADKGLKGSIQLQTPVVKSKSLPLGDGFLFCDAGRASIIDPLAGEPALTELSSWGIGIHLLPGYWINGSLTWADPLRTTPYTRRGDSRVLFLLRGTF